MRRALFGLSVLAIILGFDARAALAAGPLTFKGGPVKNLYVDLIFWGNFSAGNRQDVLTYVNQLSSWLNGGSSGPGLEPAVHYYGVSGITPGAWLINPSPVVYQVGHLDDNVFQPMAWQARVGVFGAAYDFQTNVPDPNHIVDQSSLPSGSNRLALVITKGTETYCADAGDSSLGICAPDPAYGYHWWSDSPYGAVMSESLVTLSHEVMEAMTDPHPYLNSGYGWITPTDLIFSLEACDGCPYNGLYSTITVGPPFIYGNNSGGGCNLELPEQHAPMTATFEYGGNGTQPLDLFYTMGSNGHIGSLSWSNAGQAASGPYDLGPLASGVTAVGKPSVVYSMFAGGERLFVKGSDAAVWMRYNNEWTSLGGRIYGDPKAISWTLNNATWVDVAALGTDGNLYLNPIDSNGNVYGWSGVPSPGTSLLGSPTPVSRAANIFDLFAAGEDGTLKWIEYNGGWRAPVTLPNAGSPYVSTPAVAVRSTNSLEVIAGAAISTGDRGMDQMSWNGSSWSAPQSGIFQIPTDDQKYGFQGTPAIVFSATGRQDVFAVTRSGELWWFFSPGVGSLWSSGTIIGGATVINPTGGLNPLPLVSSGVTGDPVAVSRGSGEKEVFYRTTAGSLVHLTYSNGSWGPPENLLPANSIQ
jgi:hypothetical protein